ncbi:transglycosylase domain-containing protein [Cryptosporangium aurantiacum]|uniref:Membrane carboxypeptidase (Penicillin-binding protein) n=1 Tax=Cryptosporangium aurantiacum TaxID=134849 RepID=A0A1M7RLB1_9ACTN|nr:transglycosylase domain-containing protein [Cryptosporangium aurantiacum]SHN46858.1 Membrane carboxypeptidase (penicillin-binding protein) [Cryptosporangium aurantiacum]
MSYGHTPGGGDGTPDVGPRPSSGGTVYGGSASRGASGSGEGGTVYGSRASGSSGTTYGSSAASSGTTYGSSASGTTYGSSAASSGTTYGSSASKGTTYGSGSGTTYGASSGTTYGSTAVGDRPTGLGPRSRAAALEDDQLHPEFGGMPPNGPKVKKAGRGKKILIGIGIATAVCMLLGLTGGGVAYASVDLPEFPKSSGTTSIKYADGGTFATFALENRVEVTLDKVPKHVQEAVIAVEDPDFNENSGVSFRGTARAVWGLVSGNDDAGGGSTITQQYIRNALQLTKERSYSRKVKEIILARKLSSSWSKEQILRGYLNTIYFGRGAWGIQSASKAYFNKDVEKLTAAEGAVLAAVIKDPTNFDPANKLESAQGRWGYVLDQMVKKGFIGQAERAAMTYPKATDKGSRTGAWRAGSTGILGQKIEAELKRIGFEEQVINTGGLTVYTTISSKAQQAAKKASEKYVNDETQSKEMATAMVSVDPKTGAVKAYYGGDRGYGNYDLAAAPHPAGSSYKPYVLAKGIEDGYSIDSLWDGTSGQKFRDRDTPLKNSGDDNSCGKQCSLTRATVKSLNTVYWALTLEVGASEVAKLAARAGVKTLNGKPVEQIADELNSGLGIGQYSVSVLEQAAGYGTFANYGTYHEPYFIEKVEDADGTVMWEHAAHTAEPVRAFSEDVGKDVSYVMQQVYDATNKKITDGREAAIKTGTQQYRETNDNAHAWMCGYTPQLATAVWVGGSGDDIRLIDKTTGERVYGSGIPGKIWRDYMSTALKKQPKEKFESAPHLGDKAGNAPTEEPSPTPTETPNPDNPDGDNGDGDWWGTPSTDATPDNGNGDQGETDGSDNGDGGIFNQPG